MGILCVKTFGTNETDPQLSLNSTYYGNDSCIGIIKYDAAKWSREAEEVLAKQLVERGASQVTVVRANDSRILQETSRMAIIGISQLDFRTNINISLIFNETMQHSLPILLNMVNNALFRIFIMNSGQLKDWGPIEAITEPMESFQEDSQPTLEIVLSTLFYALVYITVPCVLATDITKERLAGIRHQMRLSGVSFCTYFSSHLIPNICWMNLVNFFVFTIITAASRPYTTATFDTILVQFMELTIYAPLALICFTALAYSSQDGTSYRILIIYMSTTFGLLSFIIIMFCNLEFKDQSIGPILHVLSCLLNPPYIPFTIFYSFSRAQKALKGTEAEFAIFMKDELCSLVFLMVISTCLWYTVLIVVDCYQARGVRLFRDTIKYLIRKVKGKKLKYPEKLPTKQNGQGDNNDDDEDDVGDDHADADAGTSKQLSSIGFKKVPPVLMIKNLQKVFSKEFDGLQSGDIKRKHVAVQQLSMKVGGGEVFGLLGPLEAGKTTVMEMVSASKKPNKGCVYVNGRLLVPPPRVFVPSGLLRQISFVQQPILWCHLTVFELFEVMASIRGVPYYQIKTVVDKFIRGLELDDDAGQVVHKCSNNTIKKILFGLSMLGSSKLVLLDEPTDRLDAASKRLIWDIILTSFKDTGKAAVICTRSMVETIALCSRMGIMVSGTLRCVGSPQQINYRFTNYYNLEFIMKHNIEDKELENFINEVNNLLPGAEFKEHYEKTISFIVPRLNIASLAQTYKTIEQEKDDLDFEEFRLAIATMECAYLKMEHEEDIKKCSNQEI